jgi:hypothetical protein
VLEALGGRRTSLVILASSETFTAVAADAAACAAAAAASESFASRSAFVARPSASLVAACGCEEC